MNLLESFKRNFMPRDYTCNVCRRELTDNDNRKLALCSNCEKEFSEVGYGIVKFGGFDVHAAFEYRGAIKSYVIGYKDGAKFYLAYDIAYFLYECYKKYELKADCVCYVPSSPSAVRRRTIDAMRRVAEEFSRLSGLPVNYSLFRLNGADQTEFSGEKRRENVKNKFFCRNKVDGTVLLIDDVLTTGSTIGACAETLKKHGAAKIVGLTFASAHHDKSERV